MSAQNGLTLLVNMRRHPIKHRMLNITIKMVRVCLIRFVKCLQFWVETNIATVRKSMLQFPETSILYPAQLNFSTATILHILTKDLYLIFTKFIESTVVITKKY